MQSSKAKNNAIRDEEPTKLPRSRYARWRAATLILVYVLMVVHVVHWTLAGRTLAPLELNEVMYTLELGIVTAGFIFMAAAVLASAVFGRFFCSWGCHIMALQDLCAWLLGKLGIRPKAVRSRALLWVPVVAILYMFVWPQVRRIWEGRPTPSWRVAGDAEGWASFVTTDFWRNLPGPGIILLTFLICGFATVYFLGSRGFCAYGCPYGVIFGLVDRIAPGKIRARSGCHDCGICTAVCGSHVRVHEEIARYGMIVNPACMKDLDCVSACPDQGLYYGFGRPSLARVARGSQTVKKPYDFTWWEELVMALVVVAILAVFRGLYDLVPFLMSLGLAVISAYLVIVLLRLAYRPGVRLNRWQMKIAGRLTRPGYAYAGLMAVFVVFVAHSAFIRYHEFRGRRDFARASSGGAAGGSASAEAIHHLGSALRWGLLSSPAHQDMLANLHYRRAGDLFHALQPAEAIRQLREALRIRPDYGPAHYDLGALLVQNGEVAAGVRHLREAVRIQPQRAEAHYNLAVGLAMLGSHLEAAHEADRAWQLDPSDGPTRALRDRLQKMSQVAPPAEKASP